MADIIQTLGFDASGAIAAIGQLNSALTNLNTKLIDVAQTARVINGLNLSAQLSGMAKASAAASASVTNLGNSTNTSLTKASASANRFVLSLETISRIALAQVLVRAFGSVQQELTEAIQTAEEFNTLLAQTVAVSPRGIENFTGQINQLKGELIDASNAFGFDIIDVTNAKLQEFQNQVKGSETSTALFDSSLKLARISGSDVTQTMDALSSVLNSYDQSVEQADRASAILFKTVEVGRVQLKDIADELGNVTPLARSAGITFEEVAASLARITQAGVSPSRALTEVRALINQLQKPTKELSRIFSDVLNIASVEEGIQRFGGLKGLLEAINKEVQGSVQQTAAAFNNIRARNAFELLTEDSERFQAALDEIGQAANQSTGFLDKLLAEFNAQDAIQFRIAIENLKNEFLKLADSSLPLLTRFLNGLSVSIDNANASLQTLAGAGLAVYSSRMIAATGVTATFTGALTTASAVGVVGLGVSIGVLVGQMARFIDSSRVATREAEILASIEGPKANAFKSVDDAALKVTQDFDKMSKAGVAALNDIERKSQATNQVFVQANAAFVAGIEGSLDTILNLRTNLVNKLEKLVQDSEGRITKHREEQTTLREKISDREFTSRTSGFNDLQKSFLQTQRAQEVFNKATRQDEPGGNTNEGLKERLRLLERAEKLAQEAASSAAATGNRTALFQAEKQITDILTAQLGIKKQQETLDVAQTKLAQTNLAEQKATLEQLKDAVKNFKTNLSLFKGNTLISEDERATAKKTAEQALKDIERLALESKGISISEFLGVQSLGKQLQDEVTGIKVDFTVGRDQLLQTIQRATEGQVAQIPIEFIFNQGKALGLDLGSLDLLDPLKGAAEVVQQLGIEFKNASEAQKQFQRTTVEQGAAVEVVRKLLGDLGGGAAIGQLKQEFNELSEKTFITSKDITDLVTKIQELDSLGEIDLPGLPLLGGEAKAIGAIEAALLRLQKLQGEVISARQAAPQGRIEELKNLQAIVTNQALLQQKMQGFAQATLTAKTQTTALDGEIQEGVNTSNNLTDQYRQLLSLLQQSTAQQKQFNLEAAKTPVPKVPAQPTPRMFGGPMQYFSNGGWVRGTDSILAALTPGETVVNARASRRFAPQIAAMNAGVQPVYRAEGGPVVNNSITVGDINVNGAVGPVATGRSVVAELRREFRRGTSSRF